MRVALLFCAYNEEASLPAKINNIRAIKNLFPGIEVRVYTDACTDTSVAILQEADDILTIHEGRSRVGKATGMRVLVEATEVDILVFTDADVVIEPESISSLMSYFSDPIIGTVAGTLHYTNSEESSTARTGSLYWRLDEMIKRLESESGSMMGAGGALFAVRRSLYPVVPPNLLDDMIVSISPLFSGFRVISAPDVHAFGRATIDGSIEFRRKRRIACRAFNTHRYLRPQLRKMTFFNKFKYISHKYLRWLSPVFLMFTLVFFLSAVVHFAGIIVATTVVAAIAGVTIAGRWFDVPILSGLIEIAMSILATGIGVVEAIAGRNYQTWTLAR